MVESGRYLYAIARPFDPAALTGVQGLEGRQVRVVEHDSLVAVVSDVDLDEYGEEGLKANFERMEWLEETARRHNDVVEAVFAQGPTAPLRLATICLDDEAVRRRLDEWHHALDEVLDRVEDRVEFSVKALTQAPAPEGEPDVSAPPTSGAAYLRQKRDAARARQASEDQSVEVVENLVGALATVSVASRRLAPQDPRLTGHEGTMILNAAFLVEASRTGEFEDRVRSLTTTYDGVVIDARGPWPPYSFAMLDQA
jgi:hypothetical protein